MGLGGAGPSLGRIAVARGLTGSAGPTGPTGPTGPGGIRQTPIDANTVAQWKLVDAVGAASIAETNGAYPLNTIVGPPTFYRRGPFEASMQTYDGKYVRGASALEPPGNSISLDCWIYTIGNGGPSQYIFTKGYDNAWGTHQDSIDLSLSSNGLIAYTVIDLGTSQPYAQTAITWNVWHHLGMSYDGTTLSLYLDGELASSGHYPGSIDWGTHQDWVLGCNHLPLLRDEWYDGQIADARVSNIARPASYFRNIWETAELM